MRRFKQVDVFRRAGLRGNPFAGHPTLGSAHAWLEAGGTVRL
ncbi:hypothetical protein [Gryllotalpicola sp.]|nr:hypothetical protein [Gryllotalpicola sp.]